jgi:hypothetical protein
VATWPRSRCCSSCVAIPAICALRYPLFARCDTRYLRVAIPAICGFFRRPTTAACVSLGVGSVSAFLNLGERDFPAPTLGR